MPQPSARPLSGGLRSAPAAWARILREIANGLPSIAYWPASWRSPQTAGYSREVSHLIFG